MVVAAGLTTCEIVGGRLLFQIYEMAPVPVSVTESAEQMMVLAACNTTVGSGFTVMVTWSVAEQLFPSVPVTVYVVVAVGLTI